jgi:hypothetical protein
MKRLLDESTDELTRSLLAAGIEHRPPPGNKAQVIVAIGAGGALGLFSSNTFAWLGTTAGKVTAVGAAVGIAGAVFVAVPAARPSVEHARATAALRGSTSTSAPAPAPAPAPAVSSPAPSTASLAAPATGGLPSGRGTSATEPDSRLAQNGEPGGPSSNDPSTAARGDLPAASAERTSTRSTKARHAARNRSSKRKLTGSERAGVASSEAEHVAETEAAVAGSSTEKDRLDAEVRLIDEMHGAARRNDRDALARAVQTYRETFPDGQLKAEAAEFAARLDGSDAP